MDKKNKTRPKTDKVPTAAEKTKEKVSSSKDATSVEQTNRQQPRPSRACAIQNFLLVWLDSSIDENNSKHSRNAIIQLQQVVYAVNTFTDVNLCIDFIADIKEEKVFIIFSGALGQTTVPIVHDMQQVSSIYIFCGNRTRHEQWANKWPKIKGVFTEIIPICQALKQDARDCDENTISISCIATNDGAINQSLEQLDQSFMYTQVLKEILLSINFEQQFINEFIAYCRKQFVGITSELKYVEELEQKYRYRPPVSWYTSPCFLYSMLNRALRTMELDIIIRMGFFIRDLHENIAECHSKQYDGRHHLGSITVYRGQSLSQIDFDQLIRTKGGLLSFNNFLFTKKNRDVSLNFARQTVATTDQVGVLFVLKIDLSVSSTPFANIRDVNGHQGEDEILFSIHSVFRIGDIKQISSNNDRLWEVELILIGDNDTQLHALTERMREEIFPNKQGWYRLGHLLIRLGQFDKAQEVCAAMLNQTSKNVEKANIYHMLGMVNDSQEKYAQAMLCYEESIGIKKMILPPTHPDFAASYSNIGVAYEKMGEYPKALSSHEKALQIKQKTLPPNHPDLAISYSNIGSIYDEMGKYSEALSLHGKALEIREKTLPSHHPELAICYNNIGAVYDKMGEYAKALSYYERAVDIGQRSLPENHPHLLTYKKRVETTKKKL